MYCILLFFFLKIIFDVSFSALLRWACALLETRLCVWLCVILRLCFCFWRNKYYSPPTGLMFRSSCRLTGEDRDQLCTVATTMGIPLNLLLSDFESARLCPLCFPSDIPTSSFSDSNCTVRGRRVGGRTCDVTIVSDKAGRLFCHQSGYQCRKNIARGTWWNTASINDKLASLW